VDPDPLSPDEPSVHGYTRAAVAEFSAAAEQECRRLEAELAGAERRTARARASIGAHRVMVAMLFATQQQLDEMRAAAEAEATRVLGEAEEEAEAILSGFDLAVIDLSSIEGEAPACSSRLSSANDNAALRPRWGLGINPIDARSATSENTSAGSDAYFEFLRGALEDDQPLGPRVE
jgi:hypothetical protein